jgi:hypothetical protein
MGFFDPFISGLHGVAPPFYYYGFYYCRSKSYFILQDKMFFG